MRVAIAGADAIRVWRDVRFSSSFEKAEEGVHLDCPTIKANEIAFLAKRFGILPPLRCVVSSAVMRRNSALLDCHVLPAAIPNPHFMSFGVESAVSAPALALLQTADQLSQRKSKNERGALFSEEWSFPSEKARFDASVVLLAALATELSSNYALDITSNDGFSSRTPVMTLDDMRVFDGAFKLGGIKLFSQARGYVLPNSNSPGESSLGLIMSLPVELGGLGFSGLKMNYPVETIGNRRRRQRFIDICIPELKLAFELNSKKYHSGERANQDEERRNEIAAQGFEIFVITPEALFDADRLEECLYPALKKAGADLNYSPEYRAKRAETRALIFEVNNTICRENTGRILGDLLSLR